MNGVPPEKRRVKLTSGDLPASKVNDLFESHPFTQELDVVFPSNPALLEALTSLETSYWRCKARLLDLVDNADACIMLAEGESKLLVVSHNAYEDDVWCIDSRAHLTLSVSKDTYEQLGLVGHKLPFRQHSERHVIDIPLMKNSQTPQNLARQKTAFERWDMNRQGDLGKEESLWDVLYCSRVNTAAALPDAFPFQQSQHRRVRCTTNEIVNVHIPTLSLCPRPETARLKSDEDLEEAHENWSSRVQNLFEWLGMACLGAQRLQANDRVDPYIALYEPPTPSVVGNVTYLKWRGLLSPNFVQQVLDTSIAAVQQQQIHPSTTFIGITAHALTSSPVSYIPHTTSPSKSKKPIPSGQTPMKLPRHDGEDTWSLLFECSGGVDSVDARLVTSSRIRCERCEVSAGGNLGSRTGSTGWILPLHFL